MKKHRVFSLLQTCLALATAVVCAPAQNGFQVAPRTDSVGFRVVLEAGKLALEWAMPDRKFPALHRETLRFEDVFLDDADLAVAYFPEKSSRAAMTVGTDFSLQLRRDDGQIFAPGPGAWLSVPSPDGKLPARKLFADATETALLAGRSYTLFLTSALLVRVDCEAPRPVFSLREKLPFYGLGLAAAAAVAVGQAFNGRKKDFYENYYRRAWAEGEPIQTADPYWKSARRSERNARFFTFAGLALLAGDAAWFGLKQLKIKGKQRTFDRYCQPKIAPGALGLEVRF